MSASAKKAAVLGDQRHEAAHEITDAGLLQHCAHGARLVGTAEDGTAHQAAQLAAPLDHRLDGAQVGGDGIELLGLVGQFEQRRSVARGKPGGAGVLGCQVDDPVSLKRPRLRKPKKPIMPPVQRVCLPVPPCGVGYLS